jgi:hypothetical protein
MPNKRSDTSGFHATGSDTMFNLFCHGSHPINPVVGQEISAAPRAVQDLTMAIGLPKLCRTGLEDNIPGSTSEKGMQ